MSASDISPSVYETALRHATAVQAMTLASFTVLVYDHLLTLDAEINFIWKSRKGLVSTIFLLNRYLVPLMLIADIYEFFGLRVSSSLYCKVWTCMQSYLTIASFMSIHVIVAMRVYALLNGRLWVGRFLWISGILYGVSSTVIITVMQVPVIRNIHLGPHSLACVGSIPPYLWAVWLPSVVFETVLFALTVSAMLHRDRRQSFNTLSMILYRDGTWYFIAVALCSLFSLAVWALAGPTLIGLARYFALAMVNVAASNLVLNLKAYAASKTENKWSPPYSAIDFGGPQPTYTASESRERSHSHFDSSVDLEMYSIERQCQQLGTRLR